MYGAKPALAIDSHLSDQSQRQASATLFQFHTHGGCPHDSDVWTDVQSLAVVRRGIFAGGAVVPLTSSSVIDAAAHFIMLSPPLLTSENASRAMSAVGGEAANEAKEAQSQAAEEAQSQAVAVAVCA